MTLYFAILFFIFGLAFGSFYNVVGYRLPKKESIVFPSSRCTVCGHKLSILETIPILSYVFLGGKCKNCKVKIPYYYLLIEILTGILFALSYLKFGFTADCFMSIALLSILIITIISDYKYFIIPDVIILVGIILLSIGAFLKGGTMTPHFNWMFAFKELGITLGYGFLSFSFMFILKCIGDFLFKKESMGGGDIKLMFIIGMALSFPFSIITVFLASFLALPPALITTSKKKNHEIPFGPFLSIATLLLYFLKGIII